MANLSKPASATAVVRTTVYQQIFTVTYAYSVCFTEKIFQPDNPLLKEMICAREPDRRHRCIIFIDDGVINGRPSLAKEIEAYALAHTSNMELVLPPVSVPGGEGMKNDFYHIEWLQGLVRDNKIDRHSFIIVVGGGAVLDALGLVAATSHRGIRLIRIPTTVLSQNDSGVGVKNSVNLRGAKNFIGTFAPPYAVLNDIDFIESLPAREKIAGMAEAVKVALIRDREFFRWLETNVDALSIFERDAMSTMIRRTAELHMQQIAHGGDPFENGSARPLDFGHWAAHKIETLTRNHIRHGEAVAIGIALDTCYSVLSGLLAPGQESRVAAVLELLGFRLWHPILEARSGDGSSPIIAGLQEFREHLGGELTITLLDDIGRGIEVHQMDEDRIGEAIRWLKVRQSSQ
jgi:3-dehydroquinate synthase